MFPHTITIYHKKDGAEWLRFVISGVLWQENKGSIMRKNGVSSADGITVYIPISAGEFMIADGDMIVKGESLIEISKSTKELKDAHRVSTVDIKDYGADMMHYEVTAK